MGQEPLEWLHVSLINTATAFDTVPLINIRVQGRDGGVGVRQDRLEKRSAERETRESS